MGARCLEAVGVEKRYGGVAAVRGVDLELRCGELVAVLGPNGSGKSSLLSVVGGVLRPSGGRVRVLGVDLWGRRGVEARRLLGYLAQEDGFYPQLTGWENLAFYAAMRGARLDRGLVVELAEELGLDAAVLSKRVGGYSGGMRRKLGVIAALLHRPRVLVLDEPDGGLDPGSRRRLLGLLRGLASRGVAVLYATHLGESGAAADRVVFMHGGRVVDEGPPRVLVERYAPGVVVEVRVEDQEGFAAWLRGRGFRYAALPGGVLRVSVRGGGEAVASVAAAAARHGLLWMEARSPGLEDAFLAATGASLAGEAG